MDVLRLRQLLNDLLRARASKGGQGWVRAGKGEKGQARVS
jgi:hypothetical protein